LDSYFDLFSLPLSFELDSAALTKAYYALSKTYHPDKFTLAPETEQVAAMEMSSRVNAGYKILKKEQTRIKHILELFDAAPQEGKDSMPQEFLMEMMELNEMIMDHKMDPSADGKTKIIALIAEFESDIKTAYHEARAAFDFSYPDSDALGAIKSYYLKSKYLNRLKDNMQDKTVDI